MNNRIRVLRAERRWSQAELAERLGVSRQTVNAIENDKYDPSLPLAFKISDVFEMPIEAIFQGADRATSHESRRGALDEIEPRSTIS